MEDSHMSNTEGLPSPGGVQSTQHDEAENTFQSAAGMSLETQLGPTVAEATASSEQTNELLDTRDPESDDENATQPSQNDEPVMEPPSSSSDESEVDDTAQLRKMRKRLREQKAHIRAMERRMSAFTEQVTGLMKRSRLHLDEESWQSGSSDSPQSPASPKEPTPQQLPNEIQILPKLHLMNAQQFRHSLARDGSYARSLENNCAIDILIDELIPEQIATTTKVEPGDTTGSRGFPGEKTERYHGPPPQRIRLNTPPLVAIMEYMLNSTGWNLEKPNAVFRPYRCLLYQERSIKELLDAFKRRWSPDFRHTNEDSKETEEASANSELGGRPRTVEDTSTEVGTAMPRFCVDIQALHQLQLLVHFIDDCLKPHRDYIRSDQCKSLFFTDIYYLFEPGDLVLSPVQDQAYRVMQVCPPNQHSVHQGTTSCVFQLRCIHLDYDGKSLGPSPTTFDIPRYSGKRDVTSLPIFPFHHDKDSDKTKNVLIGRGKNFLRVVHGGHMYCKGLSIHTREQIDSEIMVDFEQTLSQNPDWCPPISERDSNGLHVKMDFTDDRCGSFECCSVNSKWVIDTYLVTDMELDHVRKNKSYLSSRAITRNTSLTDDELMLLPNRVFGFVFRNRKWAALNIEDIHEVKRVADTEGFDRLVLPKGYKKMLHSLVKHHFQMRHTEDDDEEQVDLVRGKGNGLILLLHGAPGVGKTSTAECIAESFQRPLYPITCGDLGVTPSEVEEKLQATFTLAHKWDCILLLDEADVFLSERSRDDLIRNSLVSIFLRILEYYAGVLFLTTNRVGTFDEAFRSRIHLELYYPTLDRESTINVWDVWIRQTEGLKRPIRVKKKELLKYAKQHFDAGVDGRWNGRQIRNAFQVAIALAEYEKDAAMRKNGTERDGSSDSQAVTLRPRHFEKIAEASLNFNKYIKEVFNGMSSAQRAHELSLRYDHFGRAPLSPTLDTLFSKQGASLSQAHAFRSQAAEQERPRHKSSKSAKEVKPRKSTKESSSKHSKSSGKSSKKEKLPSPSSSERDSESGGDSSSPAEDSDTDLGSGSEAE